MANINFIASAGTGKTYNLVKTVLKKIKEEKCPLNHILILTFTQKAAEEIKSRLKESIYREIDSRFMYEQLLQIEGGYIGTFHSVFLKILRQFPDKTFVDSSTDILTWQLSLFLDKYFEEWIEYDFSERMDVWIKITDILTANELKNIFKSLYSNRLRLKDEKSSYNLDERIFSLKKELEKTLEEFFQQYDYLLDIDKEKFRNDPFLIKQTLKENRLSELPEKKPSSRGLKSFLLKDNSVDGDIKDQLKRDKNFKSLDLKIYRLTVKLKKLSQLKNYTLIIERFSDFLSYIEKKKEEEKVIDFNDILLKTEKLLENEEIKRSLKEKFRYIFIDEFQDTDTIQLSIIQKISENNIYVFGDPKQCIYEWRDADLKQYFSFIKRNNFKDIYLDINHRSSKSLVEFFNLLFSKGILEHIEEKYRQPVKSSNDREGEVRVFCLKEGDVEKEALFVLSLIGDLLKKGYRYSDIMILFRRNKYIDIFSKILEERGIPVDTYTSKNLSDEPEIYLLLKILEYIYHPENSLNLFNILSSPVSDIEPEMLYKHRENLLQIESNLTALLKELIKKKDTLTLEDTVNTVLEKTYITELFSLLGRNRKKNIETVRYLSSKLSKEGFSVLDFLEYMKYSQENNILEDSNAVKLLTIHASKGLESSVVIIPNAGEEPYRTLFQPGDISVYRDHVAINLKKAKNLCFFRYEKKLKENAKNEEERLFYVAVTRAKEKLYFVSSECEKKSSGKNFRYIDLLKKNVGDRKDIWIYIEDIEDISKDQQHIPDIKENQVEILEEKLQRKYKFYHSYSPFVSVSELMNEEEVKTGRGSDISLYVGSTVHSILEKLDFKTFSIEEIKSVVDKCMDSIPEEKKKNVKEKVLSIFEVFQNSDLLKELKEADILAREMPFTLKEDNRYIEGRIDLIYKKSGSIVVMDFKTNRYETEEDIEKIKEKYKKQKEYYIKVVKKIVPERKVRFALGLLWKGEIVFY